VECPSEIVIVRDRIAQHELARLVRETFQDMVKIVVDVVQDAALRDALREIVSKLVGEGEALA
jgi:hypothetical protein